MKKSARAYWVAGLLLLVVLLSFAFIKNAGASDWVWACEMACPEAYFGKTVVCSCVPPWSYPWSCPEVDTNYPAWLGIPMPDISVVCMKAIKVYLSDPSSP